MMIMDKFRSINSSYLIFTKVLTNILALHIEKIITHRRFSFILGGYILESVVTTHEIVHDIHAGKGKRGLVYDT